MKICFMCDLHLPFDKNALQYDVLNWAVADVLKKQPDCIAYVGDVTCDGNEDVYDYFIKVINDTKIPFFYIPGNSDLRCPESKESIKEKASECKNIIGDVSVFAVNDCDNTISDEQFEILDSADDNSIIFMHHPFKNHSADSNDKLVKWREQHKETMLFYAHLHRSARDENSVSLQAMDPDKSIGECPCITYYDTETKNLRKAYYFAPVPTDIYDYFGISCYNPIKQIEFAIQNNLKNIELRPNCAECDIENLKDAINRWRSAGGECLSVHLPDVEWLDGKVSSKLHDKLIEIVEELKANQVTQHVPKVSVKEINSNPQILEKICEWLGDKLNLLTHNIVVGVENMHMTAKDNPDDTRRFGYIPEECIQFMEVLAEKTRHKVGINLDIGHARNNAPYSQKYQISTWLSMIAEYIVGYHIHQVNYEKGVFENHMPITSVYGHLISYASFFRYWAAERINKVPVVFEMKSENAYEITLKTFEEHKRKKVFDIHSHTYYSLCGRDNPHDVIKTAIQNGISKFGICDHNYGIKERKAEYLKEIHSLTEQYKDKLDLYCGIEIATLPEYYDIKDPDEIKGFDYCLIEHITDKNSFVKENVFEFCKSLGIMCGIAHTDLFLYCDMYGFEYTAFFKKMAQNNIFWEMNVSYDSIHKYKEHQYVLDFMNDKEKQQIVKDAGVYISIGFDSHRYEDYDGAKVHEMYDFLKRNDFNTVDEILIHKRPLRDVQ